MTKVYLALCLATTALIQTHRAVPATLAFGFQAVASERQLYRLLSPFCFTDGFTPSFALHVATVALYGSILEAVAIRHHAPLALRAGVPIVALALMAAAVSTRCFFVTAHSGPYATSAFFPIYHPHRFSHSWPIEARERERES